MPSDSRLDTPLGVRYNAFVYNCLKVISTLSNLLPNPDQLVSVESSTVLDVSANFDVVLKVRGGTNSYIGISARCDNLCNKKGVHRNCPPHKYECIVPYERLADFGNHSIRLMTDDGSYNTEFAKDLCEHGTRSNIGLFATYVIRSEEYIAEHYGFRHTIDDPVTIYAWNGEVERQILRKRFQHITKFLTANPQGDISPFIPKSEDFSRDNALWPSKKWSESQGMKEKVDFFYFTNAKKHLHDGVHDKWMKALKTYDIHMGVNDDEIKRF